MTSSVWTLASRFGFGAVAVGAGTLAWRVGGGAEAAAPPPRAPVTVAPDGGAASPAAGDTYEVALRLVEVAKDARFDMQKDPSTAHLLSAYWRKLRPPFVPLSGEAARWVSMIALRTSAVETQWSLAQGSGKVWTPDARIWNMNEGSFDHRESLISPGASKISFKVTIPASAKLAFAEGTLNATRDSTAFTVTLVDAKGAEHEVHRRVVPPADARKWIDAAVDLSAWAGQSVELRFATAVVPATPQEKKAATAPAPAPKKDKKAKSTGPSAGGSGSASPASAAPPSSTSPPSPPEDEALAVPGVPVGLWGNPTILAKTTPRVPYNVVWFVIDALRPDVISAFHDDAEDAAKQNAKYPPLEALLPKMPAAMPAIDDLAKRGVRFTHAYSAAAWTRPGTLAMLAGARSTELGIDTTSWLISPRDVGNFYASDPPLLPLLLRRHGVATRAFVNNYFMVGYAPVGIDMAFERVADQRWRTRDTLEVTEDATSFLRTNKDTRFFLFVNYNSPHQPYEPPKRLVDRLPPAPAGPKDPTVREYVAEASKDDEAIGVVMSTLDELGLRDRTIVVVTADHGETLSSAHGGTSGLEKMPIRYHHAVSNFEETTRVPILIVAPGLLPAGKEVKTRARTIDIAPTVLDLLGIEPHPRMSGKSLAPLAKGQTETDERVVVTEGRMSRGIMVGRHRLIVREGPARTTIIGDRTITADEELFDLAEDPGERHDLARSQPQLVAEMKARLDAALKNVPVAGTAAAVAPAASSSDPSKPPIVHLRFVGGGQSKRVSGTIVVGDAKTKPKSFEVLPVDIDKDAVKIDGGKVELALTTAATAPVGVDVVVDPPGTPVTWDLYVDDHPWPAEAVFGGPYGLLAPVLRRGIVSDEARAAASAALLPPIDPRRDSGLFVVRERRGDTDPARAGVTDEGAEEMARLLQEWGYAQKTSSSPK